MVHISVKEGLDIPIEGKPSGDVQSLPAPKLISLNLDAFPRVKFKLLAKAGERVKLGQAIATDKTVSGRHFVAPAGGVIKEVRRGLKRRLLDVVIEVDAQEEVQELGALDPRAASRESILERLKEGGGFAHIRQRPFDLLADPRQAPRCIFVKAVETAPFLPSAEMQVEGFERQFQLGISALSKLTDGRVHLVHAEDSRSDAFTAAVDCERHTVSGPHPASNSSVHIHHIDPIQSVDDIVWTLSVTDVLVIGELMATGRYHTERILSIAGGGIREDKRGFFRGRQGFPVEVLIAERNEKGLLRMISGDPLMGHKVHAEDFIGFYHSAFTVLPESVERELLHFFRLGLNKFSATKAYISGHQANDREYSFSTTNHGEERAFVDGSVYQDVMPMQIPVMHLVKALMAEDYELAEELGGLEVAAEDFALPAFICHSKIEMTQIVGDSLHNFATEALT
jgi:Na+-transporting NADH:ubiquinone oxidoreductase subunit A